MKNNLHKAFTLVELIVVITILAVLATVAFISFQGYSTESRDTKRLTDIATISKWLQVYLAANSNVPEPSETKITVSFSGSEIVTQWYAGESVLNILRVKEAQDPVDETFYTYATNPNNTKFQLVGFLENTQTVNNLMNNNLFADYSDRNIYSAWESVGIFLDETNTPIQELWNTAIELENNATVYKTVLNKQNTVTESGSTLKIKVLWAQENLFWWRAMDPNCQIDDIQIWDQVWAGCNSTLGNGMEWGLNTDNSAWNIWSCFPYYNSINYINPCQWNKIKMNSSSLATDLFWEVNDYWDREFNTIWWKLYSWDNAIQWACPVWWSLPTDEQFNILEESLWCSSTELTNIDWRCDGLWWNGATNTKPRSLAEALQLPLTGNSWLTNEFRARGNITLLWSQTQEDTKAYRRYLNVNNSWVSRNTTDKNYKLSVRCIKD